MREFIKHFSLLPLSNRSMVYLMWIYGAGGVISGIFVNIYVFQVQKEILDVVIYNIIYCTATFFGFSVLGWLVGDILKNSIKKLYYIAYFLFILGFLLIFLLKGIVGSLFFAVVYGIGNGLFRCAVHTQELIHIDDHRRDTYSSYISFGTNIIRVIVPLLVSFIFYIVGTYFKFSPYIVLFLFLPIIYITSFIFIKNVGNYNTSGIKLVDLRNFFNLKKYLFAHMYFLSMGAYQSISWALLPIVSIYLLKSEISVGLYEGIMTIISTFLIAFLSSIRKPKNRIKIMGILSLLIGLNLLAFVFNFTLVGYIIFSLLGILLNPLYRVSEHVFDLKLMDTIKIEGSDFFPTMILRDFVLWIGRSISLIILVILIKLGYNSLNIIKIGLFEIGFFMILAWIGIYLHMKYEHK